MLSLKKYVRGEYCTCIWRTSHLEEIGSFLVWRLVSGVATTVQVENFEVFLISLFSWAAAEHVEPLKVALS